MPPKSTKKEIKPTNSDTKSKVEDKAPKSTKKEIKPTNSDATTIKAKLTNEDEATKPMKKEIKLIKNNDKTTKPKHVEDKAPSQLKKKLNPQIVMKKRQKQTTRMRLKKWKLVKVNVILI